MTLDPTPPPERDEEAFRAAVEREVRLIRERGYVETPKGRLRVPVEVVSVVEQLRAVQEARSGVRLLPEGQR